MNSPTNQTLIAKDLPAAPKPSRGGAASIFAQKDRLLRWAILTILVSAVTALVSLGLALSSRQQETRFIVLDPAGDVLVMPGRTFDQAKELHTEQALLAATALLLRNPTAFDLPELLQALFSPNALGQAANLKAAEADEFAGKQIHQKPSVTRLEALEVRPDAVRIQVTGQLKRDGLFQQQPFTEVVPFVLDLILKHNPDLLRNRHQPTVVTEFALRYETTR